MTDYTGNIILGEIFSAISILFLIPPELHFSFVKSFMARRVISLERRIAVIRRLEDLCQRVYDSITRVVKRTI